MPKSNHDFSGWVTKHDIQCSDGVTIKQSAFEKSTGNRVPIVWQHNYSSPSNVLGHMYLEHRDAGVYGYGYLNETESAMDAKELLRHGDVNAMSIGARQIRKNGNDVIHGDIYEVSLVLKGANPGALVEQVMTHSSEDDGERAIIHTGIQQNLIEEEVAEMELQHAADIADNLSDSKLDAFTSLLLHGEDGLTDEELSELENLTDEELEALGKLTEEGTFDDLVEDTDDSEEEDVEEVTHSIQEGETTLKQNAFDQAQNVDYGTTDLKHSINESIVHAIDGKAGSLAGEMVADGIQGASIEHGIIGLTSLFPNTKTTSNMTIYNPGGQNVSKILGMFAKSPMSRIKNIFANISEDEARARGYIKGNEKLESIEEVFFRETTPQTIYRKTRIDRDDIIDIRENGIDVLSFMQQVQLQKLNEEIVRAAFFGDGRPLTVGGARNPEKISESHIRPIVKDDKLFVIKKEADSYETVVDTVISAFPAYQGSGSPTLFINPYDVALLQTLKDKNGRYLYGASADANRVADLTSLAAYFRCSQIVEYRLVPQGTFIIGNLSDYEFGMSRDGEVATFNQFDIDFNQEKFLIETRLSGAIRTPKSFIVITIKDAKDASDGALAFDTTGVSQEPTWTTNSDKDEDKNLGAKYASKKGVNSKAGESGGAGPSKPVVGG